MFYDIVQVIPNEDYTVYVYFEDGKIVCYDAKTLLKTSVYKGYKRDKIEMRGDRAEMSDFPLYYG